MVHIKKKILLPLTPQGNVPLLSTPSSPTPPHPKASGLEGAHHFVVLPGALSFPFLLPPLHVGFSQDSVSSSLLFLLRV